MASSLGPMSGQIWRERISATRSDDELLLVLADICYELESAGLKQLCGARLRGLEDIERLLAALANAAPFQRSAADQFRLRCAFDILSFAFVSIKYRDAPRVRE